MRPASTVLAAIAGAALIASGAAGCGSRGEEGPLRRGEPFSGYDASHTAPAPSTAGQVTADRLLRARAEPHNWLTYYGAYDGQRYSALDQINTRTVKDLRPAWIFQNGVIGLIATPATYAFEAAPIVVDGVMFVSGWDGYVWALDAATGDVFWRYRHSVPLDVPLCCGNVNRGVAVADGTVFFVTPDGHLIALDARTGTPRWDTVWLDIRAGESATVAPLVIKQMVIVGSSGAEYGVRGHIDAFDRATGKRLWRRYTVPKPGEPGSETWAAAGTWERGGGAAWITGSYDSDLNLLYWTTANPSPDFDGQVRPGDNLFTNSVLALNPDDGTVRWHYQFTPHDVWDYDGISESILFDADGRQLLAHFDKNGYLFLLDRRDGRLVRTARFFPRETTWGDIDPGSGTVHVKQIPTAQGVEICPGPAGAKEWPHAAFSRQTGLLYTPVIDVCGTYRLIPGEFRESLAYWGGDASVGRDQVRGGAVEAFDASGQPAWSWRSRQPIVSSLLATGGGLVFVGEPTGEFDALDARSGALLWTFNTGSGIHSSPTTYSVGGKQYVVVASGWGGWMKGFAPDLFGASRGGALVAFALP